MSGGISKRYHSVGSHAASAYLPIYPDTRRKDKKGQDQPQAPADETDSTSSESNATGPQQRVTGQNSVLFVARPGGETYAR